MCRCAVNTCQHRLSPPYQCQTTVASPPPPPYHGTGSETSLQQCKGRFNSPRQRCSHADDVGVRCTLPRTSNPQSDSALEDLPQYGDYIASGSELKLRNGYVQTTLRDCKQRCASMPLCKVSSSVFFSASQPDNTRVREDGGNRA